MPTIATNNNPLLDSVSAKTDLDSFLNAALEACITDQSFDEGSVFLFDGATETLQRWAHTKQTMKKLHLRLGQGIAGHGAMQRGLTIFTGNGLNPYEPWGKSTPVSRIRAIATISVYFQNEPLAVFCFNYFYNDSTTQETSLTPLEESKIKQLADWIEDIGFANALYRMWRNHALQALHTAGEGPARLRQAASQFISDMVEIFKTGDKNSPVMMYLSLVDRRHSAIRVIQGYGMSLGFQMNISHNMESDDVQAKVVEHCMPLLSVGEDPWFDKKIYDRYEHHRFVRLFLPLFPLPIESLAYRHGKTTEDLLTSMLTWRFPETPDNKYLRVTGGFNIPEVGHKIPDRLIYGTLELGYVRKSMSNLDLAPLTTDLATWCAAKAYELAESLFKATLTGSLERIGRNVARYAWPAKTTFTVPMPDWRTPETREYPVFNYWLIAEPRKGDSPPVPPQEPAILDFSETQDIHTKTTPDKKADTRKRWQETAIEMTRLAFRLSDYNSVLYSLGKRPEIENNTGMEYPDDKLKDILGEICREASAVRTTRFLFEKQTLPGEEKEKGKWRLMGLPFYWPQEEHQHLDPKMEADEKKLAIKAADTQTTQRSILREKGNEWPVMALPLELNPSFQTVIILYFMPGFHLTETIQFELEGRASRWFFRLSLRNLLVNQRFSSLMSRCRQIVAQAQETARTSSKGKIHLYSFVENVLSRFLTAVEGLAAMVTLYSETISEHVTVERYWCLKTISGEGPLIRRENYIDHNVNNPCRTALEEKRILIYPPKDKGRIQAFDIVIQYFTLRAQEMERKGDIRKAESLRDIIAFIKEEDHHQKCSILVCPIISNVEARSQVQGAMTLFLPGWHDLTQVQKSLTMETGRLLSQALNQLRTLDTENRKEWLTHIFEESRQRMTEARTTDEVIGDLFTALSKERPGADNKREKKLWNLSDHSVLWLISSKPNEIVVRSGSKQGLDALKDATIMNLNNHPWYKINKNPKKGVMDDFKVIEPKKGYPRISEFRLTQISLQDGDSAPLLHRYASLGCGGWLLSFPLMSSDQSFFGIIDCLLDFPLSPEEYNAHELMLRRLSLLVCGALDRCHFDRIIEFSREITDEVSAELESFRAYRAFRILVEKACEEMGAAHCDLFLDRDGSMILYATTRQTSPEGEGPQPNLWVKACKGPEVMGAAINKKQDIIWDHGAIVSSSIDHLSPILQQYITEDQCLERLAVPLLFAKDEKESVQGLLYLTGPLSPQPKGRKNFVGSLVNNSQITLEVRRKAKDLAVVIHRNALACRMVERQGWLVNELQHALGQPLQGLRNICGELLRSLNTIIPDSKLTDWKTSLDRGFDFIHGARENLAIYARMSTPTDQADIAKVILHQIIRECCLFYEPEARNKRCEIKQYLQFDGSINGFGPMLKAAVMNLLDNAVKYSYNNRTIDVHLKHEASSEHVVLSVENYGVGIPKPDIPRVWEPYFRSKVQDPKVARRGSGIGLAIVRHAVKNIHKGEVDVVSDPPRDLSPDLTPEEAVRYPHKTTFTISLPLNFLEKD